jgi:hypothetical protein
VAPDRLGQRPNLVGRTLRITCGTWSGPVRRAGSRSVSGTGPPAPWPLGSTTRRRTRSNASGRRRTRLCLRSATCSDPGRIREAAQPLFVLIELCVVKGEPRDRQHGRQLFMRRHRRTCPALASRLLLACLGSPLPACLRYTRLPRFDSSDDSSQSRCPPPLFPGKVLAWHSGPITDAGVDQSRVTGRRC